MEVTTAAQPGMRGDVTIEVSAENPHLRTFCWAAQTQDGPRRPRSAP
jgi:hypothetical protein